MNIIEFSYDGYKYKISKNDKYEVTKEKDGKQYDLSNDDKNLINSVINQLFDYGEVYNLGNILYKNKTYLKTVSSNGIHSFYEIDNDKLRIPEPNVLSFFNVLYNEESEIIYDSPNNETENRKHFKRLVKYKKKIIIVLCSTLIFFNILPTHSKVIEPDNNLPVIINSEEVKDDLGYFSLFSDEEIDNLTEGENESVTADEMMIALKKNNNITEEEKEYLLHNPKLFEDFSKYYIDKSVLNRLENLRIDYVNSIREPNGKSNILGEYNIITEDILLVDYGEIHFSPEERGTLYHEFVHCLTNFIYYYGTNKRLLKDCIGIIEPATEIAKKEYCNDADKLCYYNAIVRLNALMEIINPEAIQRYLCHPANEILLEEILKIIPNEIIAKQVTLKLLSLSDSLLQMECSILNLDEKKLYESETQEYGEILKKLYNAKYGESCDNNLTVMAVTNPRGFFNYICLRIPNNSMYLRIPDDDNSMYYKLELEYTKERIKYITDKPYFNKKSDSNNNEITIFYKAKNDKCISIEDAIRKDMVVKTSDGDYISNKPEEYEVVINPDGSVNYVILRGEINSFKLNNNTHNNTMNKTL